MVFGFGKLFDLNISFDSYLFEGGLEKFEVVDKFVIVLGFPVDFVHGYFSGMDDIDDLAVNGSRSELLNFSDVDLK